MSSNNHLEESDVQATGEEEGRDTNLSRSITESTLSELGESELRPDNFEGFVGQRSVKEQLRIMGKSMAAHGRPLPHLLFAGPPGLGKTTLAQVTSSKLGVGFHATSGPSLEQTKELAGVLNDLEFGDILFIDELHRLPRSVEEILYPAMEEFYIDLVVGEGPSANILKFELEPFTLIGATTREGMLSKPMRTRFGQAFRLSFYNREELAQIVERSAIQLDIEITEEAASEIAARSRGTPRLANRLLRRVRDYAIDTQFPDVSIDVADKIDIAKLSVIGVETVQDALALLGIDDAGLTKQDRRYLICLLEDFDGGPVGIETLSSTLNEEQGTLESALEPYLLRSGFVRRTPRGRILSDKGKEHLER